VLKINYLLELWQNKNQSQKLAARERQIVEAIYRLEEATVGDVLAAIDDPPSYRFCLSSLVLGSWSRVCTDNYGDLAGYTPYFSPIRHFCLPLTHTIPYNVNRLVP
jgi:hypothetical protein